MRSNKRRSDAYVNVRRFKTGRCGALRPLPLQPTYPPPNLPRPNAVPTLQGGRVVSAPDACASVFVGTEPMQWRPKRWAYDTGGLELSVGSARLPIPQRDARFAVLLVAARCRVNRNNRFSGQPQMSAACFWNKKATEKISAAVTLGTGRCGPLKVQMKTKDQRSRTTNVSACEPAKH